MVCCLGVLLCVLGFIIAMTVSALDKIGMRQLGRDGSMQEESKKMVWTLQAEHNPEWFPSHACAVWVLSHRQERADLWWRRQCLFNECPYVTVFLCVCVEASGPKVVSSWILAADSHCHVLLQPLPIYCQCQVQLSTHSTCTLSGRCFCSTSKIKKNATFPFLVSSFKINTATVRGRGPSSLGPFMMSQWCSHLSLAFSS